MNMAMMDRRAKFLAVLAFLIVSISSLRTLPFLRPWGADLHNLVVYQHCTEGRSPYSIGGRDCGDLWGRDLAYPPLLYHCYRWVRPLSLDTAMQIWTVFQVAAFTAILYAWARRIPKREKREDDWEIALFGGLLLLQYPLVFSLERGCTDVWAVLCVTGAAWLLVRRYFVYAGVALGLATAYKLYPLFSCVVIALGLCLGAWGRALRSRERWDWVRLSGGALLAFVAVFLIFFDDSRRYFFDVLPAFAKRGNPLVVFSHSLASTVGPEFPNFTLALFGSIVAVWVWAAGRAFARGDVAGAVAGALAVSTYLQGTSWDYNLVTTYPLLVVMFLRARQSGRWGVLAIGLIGIIGDRQIYQAPEPALLTPTFHIAIQVAFLILSAVVVATTAPSESAAEPKKVSV